MKLTKIVEDLYQQMTGQTDDHEVEMAITDLRATAKMAGELAQHLENEKPKDLEGWVQAKITKAADYIDAVHKNHMYSPDQDCQSCGDKLNEGKSTCCGKCGHYHVKGTSCPKPFLTGKRHCRNRPMKEGLYDFDHISLTNPKMGFLQKALVKYNRNIADLPKEILDGILDAMDQYKDS